MVKSELPKTRWQLTEAVRGESNFSEHLKLS